MLLLMFSFCCVIFFFSVTFPSSEGFSGEGCHVVASESNSEDTVCSCNHFTHFAVLFDYKGSLGVMG